VIFVKRDWGKSRKLSVLIISVSFKIQTGFLVKKTLMFLLESTF
jgi:hypothetical protein